MWILRSFSLCFSSFNLTEAGFLDGVFLKVPSPEQGLAKCQEWRSCESMLLMLATSLKFPENLGRIWKDLWSYQSRTPANAALQKTRKYKKIKAKIQHARMSMNVSVRFRAHSFFLVFSSWAWDTSHSTRSKRKISRTSAGQRPTRSATRVVFKSSRCWGAPAPVVSPSEGLRPQKRDEFFDVFHVNKYCWTCSNKKICTKNICS